MNSKPLNEWYKVSSTFLSFFNPTLEIVILIITAELYPMYNIVNSVQMMKDN